MRSQSLLAWIAVSLALALIPLAAGKPGLPATLKADEPAYLLAALSLARDGDLQCTTEDLGRLFAEFPAPPVRNLILMSGDGWHTVYFGKPYAYSLFAAPFAALFGSNGVVSFNMLLFLAMVWMGTRHLSRQGNTEMLSVLFSVGFFFLSSAFTYVFWLQPEVFMMFSVTAALYLGLRDDPPDAFPFFGKKLYPALLSGGVLALGIYHKPVLAAFALPLTLRWLLRRELRQVVAWGCGLALVLGLLMGLAVILTGHPSAYLGVARSGVTIYDPSYLPVEPVEIAPQEEPNTQNSWSWIFRLPEVDASKLREDVGYFLLGRHTGVVPYMPFALLSFLLFLGNDPRSLSRWALMAALVSVAMFFLIWIPFNWHGGGGFVGNRYFVVAYPGFLFLVGTIRPAWSVLVGYGAGALLTGTLLLIPYGAPVPRPTLQAHARDNPLRIFPRELTLREIPGYWSIVHHRSLLEGRKDLVALEGAEIWCLGGGRVPLYLQTEHPLKNPVFRLRAPVGRQKMKFSMSGETRIMELPDSDNPPPAERIVLENPKPSRVREQAGHTIYVYTLSVTTQRGVLTHRNTAEPEVFFLGAALTLLGENEELQGDLFHARWGDLELPEEVVADTEFTGRVQVFNDSQMTWPHLFPTRVNLSYHWRRADGTMTHFDGLRTPLPSSLEPGQSATVVQEFLAPEEPGSYLLELDLLWEFVGWFSRSSQGQTVTLPVEVAPNPNPQQGVSKGLSSNRSLR